MPVTEPLAAQRGFTYLWVLLLVAIMGVGLTLVAEVDSTASRRDRERELLLIGRQFQTALARYHAIPVAAGRSDYPASLEELLQDKRLPGVQRHLRKIFVDPMTGKAEWGLVLIGGRIVGVHSLSQQTPIKQDGFDPEHLGLRGKNKYAEWLFLYPSDMILDASGAVAPGTAPAPNKER